jgi:hypothetical protein
MARKKPTMQEELLVTALKEEGIITVGKFKLNHKYGFANIKGVKLGIKYPKQFLENCKKLDQTKLYKYGFKGGFTTSNHSVTITRTEILESYMNNEDSCIIETTQGIKRSDKSEFDFEYYQLIANSKFSLCPNWAGKWWDHEYSWTYRFIESCFAKSIPIVFKRAPISKNFYRDIKFFWDDESHKVSDAQYEDIVNFNYETSTKYWTLQETEIDELKNKYKD